MPTALVSLGLQASLAQLKKWNLKGGKMLIGIVGFIGSGKSAVGDILVSKYGFERDSFAAPLKDAVSTIFNWDRKLLEGDTDKGREWREQKDDYWSDVIGKPMSPRLALQLFGTECIREVFHPNVWAASLIKRSNDNDIIEDSGIVVTDCRFKNEIQAIQENDGVVIRVKRGPNPEWYNELVTYNSGNMPPEGNTMIEDLRRNGVIPHVSETDWIGSNFDYTIVNDSTLEQLAININETMRLIFE